MLWFFSIANPFGASFFALRASVFSDALRGCYWSTQWYRHVNGPWGRSYETAPQHG